jgi:hypothetical protein
MKFATSLSDLAVTLDVTSYLPGHPGSFNPRDGGSPPEGPEAEFRVLLAKPQSEASVDITDHLPDDVLEALHEEVIEMMADANADFDNAIGDRDDGYEFGDE